MAKFKTVEELGREVANEVLASLVLDGKTLREWIEQVKDSRWISVGDRLPPPDENVLYYEKGSEIDVMPGEWVREQYYEGYYKIYWMPLPEPPKEES